MARFYGRRALKSRKQRLPARAVNGREWSLNVLDDGTLLMPNALLSSDKNFVRFPRAFAASSGVSLA